MRRLWMQAAAVAFCALGIVNAAKPRRPPFEEHWIRDDSTGLRLYLRHLSLARTRTGAPTKPVLFVHGASFPSGLAAGYRFDGYSWMDQLADRGFDAWALDFAGYGKSDRYPQMTQPAESNAPLGRADVCSRQVSLAVHFIRQRTGAKRVSLVAHSWGTIVAGLYASSNQDQIDRLVLFGPVAQRQGGQKEASLPAWTCVSIADQGKRFQGYVPKGNAPVLSIQSFEPWGREYLASDPARIQRKDDCVKIPNGPSADIESAWAGHLPYDPAQITGPVLIVRGEWDTVTRNEDAAWLYAHLTGARQKRDVLIDKATHVMHLEDSRFQLYSEVAGFLDGDRHP